MSANFKGRQYASLISEEPVFDAETGVRQFDQTFAGSKSVIFGLARSFEEDGISYRVSNNGPIYTVTARVPQNDPVLENPDRYEIFTESQSLSLFQLPGIVTEMQAYDALLSDGDQTYKQWAEQYADEKNSVISNVTYPLFASLVSHLRAGVTGYEEDNLVLTRFRQIENNYAIGAGKFTLRESGQVYSTAQLNLPSDIAFGLADLPTGTLGLGRWGWRLRGQRIQRMGSLTEQNIQLTYAAWSLLAYDDATENLDW
jgi:hypothetical protein